MKAVITGNFLGTQKGKSKDGKEYCFTDIYCGNSSVRVFGLDCSTKNFEQFAIIDVLVDIFGKDVSVRAVKED